MSSTQFVEMYHPALGNRQATVPLQAVDDYAATGWLLVDPEVTPPASSVPYTTVAQVASQASDGNTPIGGALRAALGARRPKALAKFDAGLATAGFTPCRIVFAGSSTTAGTGLTVEDQRYVNLLVGMMQAAYPAPIGTETAVLSSDSATFGTPSTAIGVHGYNAGHGGTNSGNYLLADEITRVAALNPRAVIHMIGANDYATGIPAATYKTNVQAVITALKAAITGPCVHVLVQPYARFDTEDITAVAEWSEYGEALRQIAVADPDNVAFIDISEPYEQVGVPGDDPLDLIMADLTHQTPPGHAFMADLMRRELALPATPRAAPAAYDFAVDADLLVDFDASTLALADLAAVTSWAPSGGAETAPLVAGASGTVPVFRTNRVNGKPAVVFTKASSHNLTTGAWATAKPVPQTLIFAVNVAPGAANVGSIINGAVSNTYVAVVTTSTSIRIGAATLSAVAKPVGAGWHIGVAILDGANSKIYCDGLTPLTGTTDTTAQAANSGIRLGAFSGGSSGYIDMEIARVAAINRALTDDEAKAVMQSLANRYGVALTA